MFKFVILLKNVAGFFETGCIFFSKMDKKNPDFLDHDFLDFFEIFFEFFFEKMIFQTKYIFQYGLCLNCAEILEAQYTFGGPAERLKDDHF